MNYMNIFYLFFPIILFSGVKLPTGEADNPEPGKGCKYENDSNLI